MIRLAVSFLIMTSLSGAAYADTCKAQAAAKSLHGAAETSFVKKCETDSKSKCQTDAKAKNLHGAAETSFLTKCMKGA